MIKQYLITDPAYYTSDPSLCLEHLMRVQKRYLPEYICLRDKLTPDYVSLATTVANHFVHDASTKLFLHTHIKLASDLQCCGIHLTSTQCHEIAYAKSLGLEVVISTHTLEEAVYAQNEGADAITFSPIFNSPGKGKPLGLEKLKEINDKIRVKCFALGGIINTEQVKACEAVGVYGFASIRFFVD